MSEILFINACISTGHPSRTLFLARYFLKQLAKNTQSKITEIDELSETIEQLAKDLKSSSSKMSKIILKEFPFVTSASYVNPKDTKPAAYCQNQRHIYIKNKICYKGDRNKGKKKK